ncbi:MAG: aminotransferase class V-fold PLP-dependent enzyme, partial [Candidatus Moraniibacteriota bacterium]
NPVGDIVRIIKEKNPKCITIIDAAQAVGHVAIDAKEWDADFIAFSGHKGYGPTGIGVLYGKKEILEQLPPVTFGGGMVIDSCSPLPEYREIPYRFEAGTPNISGAIGLGAAIDFIESIDLTILREHDTLLTKYAFEKLRSAFGDSIHILGPSDIEKRSSIISFTIEGIHPHDLAELLGERDICIRAGEHCAAPLHRALDLPATARVSFGVYTTEEDIDRLTEGMKDILCLFKNTEQKTQKPNKAQS